MEVFRTINELSAWLMMQKQYGRSIGLVPTMGFLHEGHISLMSASLAANDITVVSIFINPTQFGPNEDFERYPRSFDRDKALLLETGVDAVFAPEISEMYPEGFNTVVSVTELQHCLCGASRPGHFDGVATIVLKLFNIVRPDNAYFGEKDYQQLLIIKKMVGDLNLSVSIHGVPIVRDSDGLAKSSRNLYLSVFARDSALSLNRAFYIIESGCQEGKSPSGVIEQVRSYISSFPYTKIDYVELRDPEDLMPITTLAQPFRAFLAVWVDGTRLIDNKAFGD